MAGFSAGMSIFSRCNKADSIPEFTAQLVKTPNHYNSLIWRGRAYGIIGENANSIGDYETAYRTSSDPQKSLAQVLLEKAKGNIPSSKRILNETIGRYPTCAEAYFLKGELDSENIVMEIENFARAIQEGKSQNLQTEPWYPWANYFMGNYYGARENINEAMGYFTEAIDSCDSLTVAHIGISRCWYIKKNEEMAKFHFMKARSLNPTVTPWSTYEDFKQDIQEQQQNPQLKQATSDIRHLNLRSDDSERSSEHERRSGGNSGGGNSGGSDDDDDDEDKWKKVKKNSPCHAEYEGKIFVQSRDGKEWYVRDKAGHAGAYLKVYRDKGNSLEFNGSLDIKMRPIRGKHESARMPVIRKNDLNIRRGHPKK